MTARSIEGGCYCGAVRYRIVGQPLGAMICHCRSCRRIAAAPLVGWLTIGRGQFEFTKGRPRKLRSSARVTRWFCARCGTHLTYARAQLPAEIDVTTCSLDRPERWPPTHQDWTIHRLPWVRFGHRLRTFPRSHPPAGRSLRSAS